MPPKKKIKSGPSEAKTLPGCNGRDPVNPPSTPRSTTTKKPRALELQGKEWLTDRVFDDLNRELERHGMPPLKKRRGNVRAKEIHTIEGTAEGTIEDKANAEAAAKAEKSLESDKSDAKEEEEENKSKAKPEPKPESEPKTVTMIESDKAEAKKDDHKLEPGPQPEPELRQKLDLEPGSVSEPGSVPGPKVKAKAQAKKGKKKEQRRYTAEEKGKGREPTLLELEALKGSTDEAPHLPETSLAEEKGVPQPELENHASQPQPEKTISQPEAEESTSQPEPEKDISRPQTEESLPQLQSEENISQPQPQLNLETAPAVESDEQNDIFWKLIDFFNSAPPLPDPPAHPPSTPISTTKAASAPLVTSVYSPASTPPPNLSFSPSTLSAPCTLPGPEEYEDGDKWDLMSFEWTDDDPMELSGWDFQFKPALSIYTPNPWTEPNHELDTIMTVEVEDGAFDVAQWLRDQYDANVETTANCKFEHPGSRPSGNPFAPLQNSFQNNNNNNNAPRGSSAADFYLNRDAIQKDLQEERPEWILSAYGPGRDAPEQLWGGIIEQSPEEMRLHAMTCEAAGNLQGALSDFEMLKSKAQEKIGAAYNDPDAAINYIMSALNKQPNRLSIAANNMNGEFAVGKRPVGFGPSSAFSTGSANASPFGQPSTSAQPANPFKSGTSGFGQPSALGQTPNAFGQPASVFSQPSAMGSGTGFGQPSALGQQPSAFAAPSTAGTQNAFSRGTGFGQPSSLGAKPNPFGTPSPFGQPSQPAPSPFGQPSQLGAKPSPFSNAATNSASTASPFSAFASSNAPGGNAFGAAASSTTNAFSSNNQPNNSPFAQPQPAASTEVSMDSSSAPTTSPFAAAGNSANTAGPFGQPPSTTNAFGQPPAANPFGNPQQPAFGQPSQQKPNPFASAAASSQPSSLTAAPSTAASAGPPGNGPYGPNATRQHPAYSSYAQKDPATGQLQSFKGRPVMYKQIDEKPTPHVQNMDGTASKIWFPDGAPQYYQDTEPDREYTDAEKNLWQGFQQTGKFQLAANGGGGMPLAPPMRESVQWDF